MPNPSGLQALHERVARCQESVTAFVRIQQDLLAIQKQSAEGTARERMDGMIKLNQDTLAVIRRRLFLAENELNRAIGSDPGETP